MTLSPDIAPLRPKSLPSRRRFKRLRTDDSGLGHPDSPSTLGTATPAARALRSHPLTNERKET